MTLSLTWKGGARGGRTRRRPTPRIPRRTPPLRRVDPGIPGCADKRVGGADRLGCAARGRSVRVGLKQSVWLTSPRRTRRRTRCGANVSPVRRPVRRPGRSPNVGVAVNDRPAPPSADADGLALRSAWWVDDPVTTADDDRFLRDPFAAQVAGLLRQVGAVGISTVVGLTGPWGSGKTSTLHMCVNALPAEDWKVEWLNPWAVSGTEGIVAEVLATIREALPAGTVGERAKDMLQTYGRYATPLLGLLPGGNLAREYVGLVYEQRDRTLNKAMHDLAAALSELPLNTLVVVDDVDRLQPDELLTLLRAV